MGKLFFLYSGVVSVTVAASCGQFSTLVFAGLNSLGPPHLCVQYKLRKSPEKKKFILALPELWGSRKQSPRLSRFGKNMEKKVIHLEKSRCGFPLEADNVLDDWALLDYCTLKVTGTYYTPF